MPCQSVSLELRHAKASGSSPMFDPRTDGQLSDKAAFIPKSIMPAGAADPLFPKQLTWATLRVR